MNGLDGFPNSGRDDRFPSRPAGLPIFDSLRSENLGRADLRPGPEVLLRGMYAIPLEVGRGQKSHAVYSVNACNAHFSRKGIFHNASATSNGTIRAFLHTLDKKYTPVYFYWERLEYLAADFG